jgi:hypothetical protein
MDEILNIRDDYETTFTYDTKYSTKVVNLRKALFENIEIYSIYAISCHLTGRALEEVELAHRFGLLQLEQKEYDENKVYMFYFKNTTDDLYMVTTDDIRELQFIRKNKIVVLEPGETMEIGLIIKKGNGYYHSKNTPIAKFCMEKVNNSYQCKFKNIGFKKSKELITEAMIAVQKENLYETDPLMERFYD